MLASCMQRLYMEVRHAVRQLCVREAGAGAGPGAWFAAEGGGLKRKPMDASSLPGPWGGQKLHVQPRQANGEDSEQLPKVNCLCVSQFLWGFFNNRYKRCVLLRDVQVKCCLLAPVHEWIWLETYKNREQQYLGPVHECMYSINVGLMWVVCGAGVGRAGRAGASASSGGDGAQATGAASVRPQEDGRRLGPAPAQPHTWAP